MSGSKDCHLDDVSVVKGEITAGLIVEAGYSCLNCLPFYQKFNSVGRREGTNSHHGSPIHFLDITYVILGVR